MNYNIAVLAGDGIGPEVTKQAIKTLNAISEVYGHHFYYTEASVGAIAIEETGNPLPEKTLEVCYNSNAILFGAIGDPKYDNNPNAKVRPEQGLLQLRKSLGLYTNIRPVRAYEAVMDRSPLKRDRILGTDFTIYRELTGGIYFGEKNLSEDGTTASDLCTYTEKEVERIAHLAFKAARTRKNKLTLVDKANVLESSRLWRRVVTEIGKSYPEVEIEYLFVDNAAMQIIVNPSQFDVILTENMFGDILSDEASVIGGSIGMLASASIGDSSALFEPIHGSYPQATGKNIANPIASILSAAMLLSHLGLTEESEVVNKAVDIALDKGIVTADIDPKSNYGTEEVGDYIASKIHDIDNIKPLNKENIDFGKSTII
ncbi:MAG: 3-isopropylmalate dehydrogenase [Flavobacteriaceae bacterium]|nr:3-isopropylmalate dehydrogenase [Flavobacteriaceae bacterium]